MGYLPNFEYDIFISYSHKDNEPPFTWVDDFEQALRACLRQALGTDFKIWRDKSGLMTNDYFERVIKNRLSEAAFLVPILSPNYIKSKWCTKELQEFCRLAEREAERSINDKSRIFKIVKSEVPLDQHPPELKGLTSDEFYGEDPDTGRLRDFSFDSDATHRKFMDKINDVVYGIRNMVELSNKVRQAPQTKATVPPPGEQTIVYLAETTSDQKDTREAIRHELDQRGYLILPDCPLPCTSAYKQLARENLKRSRLSVHIVGEKYAVVPEDESRSIVELQIDLATESDDGPPFSRLIWMPEGLVAREERQQKFIDQLANVSDPQKRVEVLQKMPVEGLKTYIEDKLRTIQEQLRAKKERQDRKGNGRAHVYLIYDQQDLDEGESLADYLFNSCGYDTFRPETQGDENELGKTHEWNLQLCDAILIYYHNANLSWLNRKLRELVSVKINQSKKFLAEAVYMIGPKANEQPKINLHDMKFIRSFEGFSPDLLKPFLMDLESVKEG